MKGKILRFDAATGSGAIAGENGERFTFVTAQWRGERAPAPGAGVDFAPVAGVATEIYPVGGPVFNGADAAAIAQLPGVQRIKELLTGTLAVPLALMVLLAFLMPALSSPVKSASFIEVGTLPALLNGGTTSAYDLSQLKSRAGQIDENTARLKEYLAKAGPNRPAWDSASAIASFQIRDAQAQLDRAVKDRAELDEQIAHGSGKATAESLLVLRYAAPLLALFVLWRAWTGAPLRTPSLLAAGGAMVAVAAIYALKASLGTGMEMMDERIQSLVSLGIGTWLMAACGVGLILAGLGVIRNPLAAKA